ncbi:zinc transporter, ZIP family [Natronincola peptidivorans]|uniref:Zinc transporter, ZIP family n=1 Tax=Natronincola peptidivorans TaxID=426128 RepID=A0A1H9ZNT2_9FIRM|nr:ZIP family metal transporter [Natronincola peptidivorans]SES82486.1 zinc transporter, ZIP family [Natronincola peptidivorans]
MSDLWRTTLIGLMVGMIGTGLGGSMAFLLKNPSKRFLSGIIGLSSGLMVAIVTFELIPEAFMLGGTIQIAVGIAIGAFLASYLDIMISHLYKKSLYGKPGFIKTGVLLGVGIALHNFPEGLAIGSGFVAQSRLGVGLAIVIALHNMPEGLAMVTPMRVGGYSSTKAFLLTLAAGAPMGLGAFVGAFIGTFAYGFIGVCLAFAGGTMLYITFGELIPRAKDLYGGRISTICSIFGFIAGMLISKSF